MARRLRYTPGMSRALTLSIAVLAASACTPTPELALPCNSTGDTICVAPYQDPCHTLVPTLCLRLFTSTSTETSRMFFGIEGFEHQWGHTYELAVHRVTVPDPPADGSSVRTILDRVVSDTPVAPGTHFTIRPSPEHIRGTAGVDLSLVDQPLLCGGGACIALEAARAGTEPFELELSFPEVEGEPLVVEDVR